MQREIKKEIEDTLQTVEEREQVRVLHADAGSDGLIHLPHEELKILLRFHHGLENGIC